MPPPRSINIGPYSFPITAGYSDATDGFVIGGPEREALDYIRAERVRKKAHRVFERLRTKSGRKTLTEGELAQLSEIVAEFDRTMRLEPRGADTTPKANYVTGEPVLASEPSDFDTEVTRLADLRIGAEETARGLTLTPQQREAAIAALRNDPLLREEARKRVEVALIEHEKMLSELF